MIDLDHRCDLIRGALEFGTLAAQRLRTADVVDRAARGHGHQPARRVVGYADPRPLLESSDENTILVCDTRAALREQKELRGCDTSVGARILFLGGGTWDPTGAAMAIGMRASLLEKPFVRGDVRARVTSLLRFADADVAALSAAALSA